MTTYFEVYSPKRPGASWVFPLTVPIGASHEHYAETWGLPLSDVHWRWWTPSEPFSASQGAE